jgi:hypothetical protein
MLRDLLGREGVLVGRRHVATLAHLIRWRLLLGLASVAQCADMA